MTVAADGATADLEVYAEAPFNPDWSLVGTARQTDAFAVEAAVKAIVWRTDAFVAGAQLGVAGTDGPEWGCAAWGYEGRGLIGWDFGPGFLAAEAAARRHGGCDAGRLDLTLGWRPQRAWLTLGQVFINRDDGGRARSTAQVSLVSLADDGPGLQLGLRLREGDDTVSLVVAIWDQLRFR